MKFMRMGIFLAACCFAAQADMITFDTAVGATTSGGAVDATATITTAAGMITLSLTNLEANPTDVAQNLSDFEFTLSDGMATGATFAAGAVDSAQQITVNHGGTATLGSSLTTAAAIDWALSTPTTAEIMLDKLPNGPSQLIIGPSASGGLYSNANGSIAGNGPHNAFLDQTVTWVIDDPNVTADSTVTAATFSFGTTEGADLVPGTLVPGSPVPEPSFYGAVAAGLAGLLIAARRSSAPQNLRS